MAVKSTRIFPQGFIGWFSRHYMLVINTLLAIFILFTLAAPVCMELGWEKPGKVIYLFYRQFCHQFAFRSWFLFGIQPYYPKEASGEMLTYQDMFAKSPNDLFMARSIIGNETAGYKVAICQRDFGMYFTLLLFGLIFSVSKNSIPKVPLVIWLVVGVLPLGVDGLTQLSSTGWNLFNLISMRESTPLIRTLTGGLFGFFSGWYIFPSFENSFRINRKQKTVNIPRNF